MTIGNTSRNRAVGSIKNSYQVSQSFVNDTTGTGASVLLNDWTFAVTEFNGSIDEQDALFTAATLNIYAGTGIGGTLIGSATTYDSSVILAGFKAAKWTFGAGGLSLIDNQTYSAAVISSDFQVIDFETSDANPYPNGLVTRSDGAEDLSSYDTVFSANFSSAPTPVPFEFEPTGGLLVLGGGWLLRRHLKKKAKKD